MTIDGYLDSVKERLLSDPSIANFHIVRERVMFTNGHLRARLVLEDGSLLEFSEYIQCLPDDQITVITYSYHWSDAEGHLIQRWDNTPHFPELPGFPHHIHSGRTGHVTAGKPVSIFEVLDMIEGQTQTFCG